MSEYGEDYWVDLGKRAVACEGWRWMPGMADLASRRVCEVVCDEVGYAEHRFSDYGSGDAVILDVPDLRDPATVGCLLAEVREAWGDPGVAARAGAGFWIVAVCPLGRWGEEFVGETEAEALVAALECAPKGGDQ